MKYSIIFVDDSISVLESLQWIFMDEPYYLFAFDSPLDALSVIESSEIAVVVAEQSMQNMDVLEFLKRFQAQSPHTMGIIMTGYDEFVEVSDKLCPDCLYQFVKKPLDNREIKQAVKAAIINYEKNEGRKRWAVSILPKLSSLHL